MYEPAETQTSQKYLEKIFKLIKGNTCLLGGWAARHLVNKNFEKVTGRSYIGSRDIDIGFHTDKKTGQKNNRENQKSAPPSIKWKTWDSNPSICLPGRNLF